MFVSCPLGWSNGEEEAEGKKTKKDDTAEQVSLAKSSMQSGAYHGVAKHWCELYCLL